MEVSSDGQAHLRAVHEAGRRQHLGDHGDELDQEQGTLGGCISSNGLSGGDVGVECINGADTLGTA